MKRLNSIGERRAKNKLPYEYCRHNHFDFNSKLIVKSANSYRYNTESVILRSLEKAIELGPIPIIPYSEYKKPTTYIHAQIKIIMTWADKLRYNLLPMCRMYSIKPNVMAAEFHALTEPLLQTISNEYIAKPLVALQKYLNGQNWYIGFRSHPYHGEFFGGAYSCMTLFKKNLAPSPPTMIICKMLFKNIRAFIESYALSGTLYTIRKERGTYDYIITLSNPTAGALRATFSDSSIITPDTFEIIP